MLVGMGGGAVGRALNKDKEALNVITQRINSLLTFIPSTALINGVAVTYSFLSAPLPATVWVNPRGGDTVDVWVRYEAGGDLEEWTPGAVSVVTAYVIDANVYEIVFQRVSGVGITSTYGVNG